MNGEKINWLVVAFLLLFLFSLILTYFGIRSGNSPESEDISIDENLFDSEEEIYLDRYFQDEFNTPLSEYHKDEDDGGTVEYCVINGQSVRVGVASGDTMCALE